MLCVTSDMQWLTAFDEFAQSYLTRHEVPGAAISIVGPGGSVYSRGFGYRDREGSLPATSSTIFGIASLSKSFTALTALALQARGALNIDDPVARHLPGFGYPGLDPDVRLRHLLSHSSGLPPLRALDFAIHPSQVNDPAAMYNRRDYTDAPAVDDYEQLMAYMRAGERPALAQPGAVMSYSNEGVALVGAVIESATGEPFPAVARRLVFEPLGMHHTTFDTVEAQLSGERTTLYTRIPDRTIIRSPEWEEAPAYLGTGFLKSSADDLGRYLTALLARGRPVGIDERLFGELLVPRVWSEPGGNYAFGWQVRPHRGVTVVRHGGSLKGVSSHQGFVPELGFGMAILTNLDEVPVKRLWTAALNLALGQPPE
ncbi:MAG TPA: serine hydrolase domain-containing protein, partial [Trueperaceae bacterium]|nr:serine hydrolase domain-containing protein [Trueperaceae bacterium]